MKYNPQYHHRRSIRLKGYDYTQPGAYFVTLVCRKRESIFGQIVRGNIQLSPLGEIVRQEWLRSAQMRREIELHVDEFVVMPNHFHGIVWIVGVGADGVRPMGLLPNSDGHPDGAQPSDARRAPIRRVGGSLASFVAGFKSSVTSRSRRELDTREVWQRNYYEHIIRDSADLEHVRAYIHNNPIQWEIDQLHPAAAPNPFNQD